MTATSDKTAAVFGPLAGNGVECNDRALIDYAIRWVIPAVDRSPRSLPGSACRVECSTARSCRYSSVVRQPSARRSV